MPLDLQHGRAAWESRRGYRCNFNLILSHSNPPPSLGTKALSASVADKV